jgi:hypothetical protein
VWENASETLVIETSDRNWIIWIRASEVRLGEHFGTEYECTMRNKKENTVYLFTDDGAVHAIMYTSLVIPKKDSSYLPTSSSSTSSTPTSSTPTITATYYSN